MGHQTGWGCVLGSGLAQDGLSASQGSPPYPAVRKGMSRAFPVALGGVSDAGDVRAKSPKLQASASFLVRGFISGVRRLGPQKPSVSYGNPAITLEARFLKCRDIVPEEPMLAFPKCRWMVPEGAITVPGVSKVADFILSRSAI